VDSAEPVLGSTRAELCAATVLGLLVCALLHGPVSCRPADVDSIPGRLAQIDRPNIVLIVVDALRADAISPYGFDPRVSPELERFAEHGVVFERALAQSSWTKVSMASLLTSLWPQSHGVRRHSDALAEAALTLQDVLKQAGYHTYAVQSNGWLEQSFGFHHGFDRYVFPHANTMARQLGTSSVWPHGERIFEETTRLIDAHDAAAPFFLYLHFMDVHEYAAPPEFKLFGNEQRAAYSASIRWVDDVVKRVRDQLEETGLTERTILVFASDHGEAFGENRAWGHANNVHTPVLHVPLMIRFPFDIDGRRIHSLVRNLDIAPTILELAGVPVPTSFEGESLLPLITSPEPAPDRVSYAALGLPVLVGVIEQVSVVDGAWSLARNLDEKGKEFLFDRKLDPLEDANLLDFEPAQVEHMRALLDAHLATELRPGTHVEDVRIDPAIAKRLKALGYLQ